MTDEIETTTKRRFMNDHESFKAMGMLSAHLQQIGAEFAYEGGWSDQRIADEVGVTMNNIVGLRTRAFGKLAKAVEIITDPRLELLIAAHNEFVRDAAGWIRETNPGLAIDETPYLIEPTP